MSSRAYTVLGWAIWQLLMRLAKREIRRNRTKVAAAGVVLLVLAGGVAAARSGSNDD
jgi:hypothetical protein